MNHNRNRVIVVNDYGHSYGGAAQVAISSLNSLADASWEVIFVSGVGPVDCRIDRSKVRCVNLGLPDLLDNPSRIQAFGRGIWDTRCAEVLRKVLKNCDPARDIVHLHSWVKCLSSSVAQAAIELGFKVVCTLHDYFTVCPNGGLYNFQERRACPLRPMSLACVATNCDSRHYAHKLWRTARWVVQDQLGGIPSRIDGFIAVSEYSERLLRPFLPISSKFFRIRNPIVIDQQPPSPVVENDAFTFIGRLSMEKGPQIFAAAAKAANLRAVFAGSGPSEKSILGINEDAELLGWLDRAEVMRTLRGSRALVFPSIWHETQGMAVLEAAALGVPAIVSDSCAASEAVVDGETGFLFKAGDHLDLAAKLLLLKRNPELAANCGLRAYEQYWGAPSTVEVHTKELIACYYELLSGRVA